MQVVQRVGGTQHGFHIAHGQWDPYEAEKSSNGGSCMQLGGPGVFCLQAGQRTCAIQATFWFTDNQNVGR